MGDIVNQIELELFNHDQCSMKYHIMYDHLSYSLRLFGSPYDNSHATLERVHRDLKSRRSPSATLSFERMELRRFVLMNALEREFVACESVQDSEQQAAVMLWGE
ncbi:hypothetical protein PMAYCL1PPCAC_05420 [Pristionchus mayeri]|uniref:Uncharacterized protein n=1 Tax=Pristionchus mayeri TaxID=1317129 RepID=A0AAN5C923_9BILA|nr:hypothetical protein PMAYCL1PPCAC_05420 [Pristionchus mayeri]